MARLTGGFVTEEDKIIKIDLAIAGPFIKRWHYSKNVPRGGNIYFGWYIEDTLYAVANYGIGVNAYQAAYLAKQTGKEVTKENLLELKRLCRSEPKLCRHPLTRFLSKCHKILKAMGYKYVVSFSDPAWGHVGGIYKAACFEHLGTTKAEMHVKDKNGEVHHRRYPYRYSRRHGCTIGEARYILGLVRVQTLPKDRWFKSL